LGALDLKLREHMKIELKQLQASFGTTFVTSPTIQSEALVLSDHVGVMSHADSNNWALRRICTTGRKRRSSRDSWREQPDRRAHDPNGRRDR